MLLYWHRIPLCCGARKVNGSLLENRQLSGAYQSISGRKRSIKDSSRMRFVSLLVILVFVLSNAHEDVGGTFNLFVRNSDRLANRLIVVNTDVRWKFECSQYNL